MTYQVEMKRSAQQDLRNVKSHVEQQRIAAGLRRLAEDPRPPGALLLKGRKRRLWRIRVGDRRIVYEINDKARVVTIVTINRRATVYERE